jgi:hypothetical protein
VPMTRRPQPGQPPEDVGSPQRLEVVVFQSPVPTLRPDPFEDALPSRWASHQRTLKQTKAASGESAADQAADDQAAEDLSTMPVRAVRGAFEIRPQPPKGVVQQGQVMPASLPVGTPPTGLWQVWWVPLPRLNADGTMLLSDDDPDLAPAQPYLVASDLRYIRWTVFHEKERKTQLASTWSGDLPGYVEVEVQTASGQAVNWMFEVDWANGPEVPKLAPKAGQTNPDGSKAPAQGTQAATPLQPAQPASPGTGGKPSK